jgi:hypothetical protein
MLLRQRSSRPIWISVRLVCAYAYEPIDLTVLSQTPSVAQKMPRQLIAMVMKKGFRE